MWALQILEISTAQGMTLLVQSILAILPGIEGGYQIIVIRTINDVRRLVQEGSLPKEYSDHIKEFFLSIYEAFGYGQDIETFTLAGTAEIIILDGKVDSGEIRIPVIPGKPYLLDTWPEYVERYDLGPVAVYKIVSMPDNDCVVNIFSEVGQLDGEVEKWLEEQLNYPETSII